MALEICRFLRSGATILDVGCGNGFIAHHLSGLLQTTVVGMDVAQNTSARINFVPYDGRHFPMRDRSVDAVLLCYVLHHAHDAVLVLNEVRRVLKAGGLVIVYEDNPSSWWDRAVCWSHNKQWEGRTGPCTFQLRDDWRRIFALAGLRVVSQRRLSRWRNMAHPVSRNFFVLETEPRGATTRLTHRNEPAVLPRQQEIRAGI
jgi:ubiquinone/menaquinone biosynthesis C-methylase UbiE